MKRFILASATTALCIIAFIFVTGCQHSKPAAVGEWRTLLDANHTTGWRMVGPGEFKAEEGALVTHGGMGLFFYERERLGNCQIRVVFKLTHPDDNAGVFIRIANPPNDPWDAVNNGYEVQIHNGGDARHRTGVLYSFTSPKNLVNARLDDWSTMLITLDGKRTVVEVDGVLVTDFTEGDPVPERQIWYEGKRGPRVEHGYIGLQNHGHGAEVHFKEVSVAPLN